jgi:cobalamin biosynthesis protein CobD/CbiB
MLELVKTIALLVFIVEASLSAVTFWLVLSYGAREPFVRFYSDDAWYYLVWGSTLLGVRVSVAMFVVAMLVIFKPRHPKLPWMIALYLAWSLLVFAANFSAVEQFLFDVERYQVKSAA